MDKIFKEHYYTDSNVYNKNQLWKRIQSDERYDNKIKRKNFDDWLKDQEVEQLNKVKYKPPLQLTHPIIAKPNSYQTDLMFIKEYHSLNNKYDSIINFIEITSKKVFAYPMKTKTSSEVFSAFKMFYKEIDGNIDYLEIDKGTEFVEVIKFCDDNDIHVTVYNADKNSMSVVERFNRTLRGYIVKNCRDGVWYKKLDKLINAYNDNEHSSTSYKPNYLFTHPKLQIELREILIGKSIPAKLELKKFKVNDQVRYFKKKKLFGKGVGEYSDTVHTITDIIGNSVFLDGNDKKYRYYNLLKVGKNDKIIDNRQPDNEIRDQAKKNYKTALKLAKEQTEKISVKDLDEKLQNILNDDTMGRGKRIKVPINRFG